MEKYLIAAAAVPVSMLSTRINGTGCGDGARVPLISVMTVRRNSHPRMLLRSRGRAFAPANASQEQRMDEMLEGFNFADKTSN